jgi:vitamin B12 transporter
VKIPHGRATVISERTGCSKPLFREEWEGCQICDDLRVRRPASELSSTLKEARHLMLVKPARIVIFSLFALGTMHHCAQAQTQTAPHGAPLIGKILDPQSRPVPGARVTLFSRLNGLVANTVSDASGQYSVTAATSGEYLMRVEAAGFASITEPRVRLEWGHTTEKNIDLSIAGTHEQITVTASGTPQPSDEVSKAIRAVDRDEMDQRGVQAIGPVTALEPGLRVQQSGGPGALTTIRIRGMRDQDTAVLIDGERLRDAGAIQANASGFLSDLMLTDSSRVEILNGAGSSLYGTTAIGGVMNVLTDQGGGRTRASFAADGGSLGSMRGRASVSGSAWKERLQYSAGVAHWNVLNGVDGDDAYRNTSAQGYAGYRITPTSLLSARVFMADSFGKLNSDPVQAGTLPSSGIVTAAPYINFLPGPNDSDAARAGRFLSGSMIWSGQPAPRFTYSLGFHTVESSRRYTDGPAGSGYQPFGSTRSLFDGRLQTIHARVHYQLGAANLLSAGYEFENENFAFDYVDHSDPGSPSALSATQQSHAVFVQDQARLLDGRLLLTGAFRAQSFDLKQPSFLPTATAPYQGIAFASPPAAYTGDGSAAYMFRTTGTKLRAHVGRGYRTPSLYERFGASFDSFFGYSQFGDPQLKPERSISGDAGIDQTIGNRMTLSATYFYTSLQQTIGFGSLTGADPFGRFFGYLNLHGGLSRGVEVSAKASVLRTLDVSAAYTYVDAREKTPLADDVLRRFVIPRHQFSLFAVKRMGRRWLMTFDTLQSGTYLAPILNSSYTQRVYAFDGVRRINAGVSYRISWKESGAMRVYVRGENLTGQDYYENGFRTPGRTGMAGVQLAF